MADANIIVAVDHAIDVIEYLFSVNKKLVSEKPAWQLVCQTVPFIVIAYFERRG